MQTNKSRVAQSACAVYLGRRQGAVSQQRTLCGNVPLVVLSGNRQRRARRRTLATRTTWSCTRSVRSRSQSTINGSRSFFVIKNDGHIFARAFAGGCRSTGRHPSRATTRTSTCRLQTHGVCTCEMSRPLTVVGISLTTDKRFIIGSNCFWNHYCGWK